MRRPLSAPERPDAAQFIIASIVDAEFFPLAH
jgi:hypothetical protein